MISCNECGRPIVFRTRPDGVRYPVHVRDGCRNPIPQTQRAE